MEEENYEGRTQEASTANKRGMMKGYDERDR